MSDERVYQAERFQDFTIGAGGRGWLFVGDFTETDWHLGESFRNVARERKWPAGNYRLSRLDDSGVSGSFFLYTLTVETETRYEAAPTAAKVEATA